MEEKKEQTMAFCACDVVHEDVVERVKANMPEESRLFDLADFFKVFGDCTRIRILRALEESEMCVCDLAAVLSMTKSAVSHQLRTLRQSKLVRFRKQGKNVFYSLDDDHVKTILDMALSHLSE